MKLLCIILAVALLVLGARYGVLYLDNKTLQQQLAKLGIDLGDNSASGGPDVSVLKAQGVPVVSLQQDGTDYFDYHHTPNDTLDKIDPAALQQNLQVWLHTVSAVANSRIDLRK